MHELSLFSSVPVSRHTQILNVLTGIAAMQPQPFYEKHLIFKPTRPASSARAPIQVGGSQAVGVGRDMMALGGQGDLFYLHLVRDLVSVMDDRTDDSGDGGDGDVVMGEGETENEVRLLNFPSNMCHNFYLLLSFYFSRPGVRHLLNLGVKQLLSYIS